MDPLKIKCRPRVTIPEKTVAILFALACLVAFLLFGCDSPGMPAPDAGDAVAAQRGPAPDAGRGADLAPAPDVFVNRETNNAPDLTNSGDACAPTCNLSPDGTCCLCDVGDGVNLACCYAVRPLATPENTRSCCGTPCR